MSDPIDRQDAIRIVDGIDTWQAGWRGDAIESIKALPSAQPEQPPYIAEIESEYRKAVNNPYIKKPLAKAIYEVWKCREIRRGE